MSATLEEGSWISTSYLVAEIIMIPLTAWLVQLLSARRLAVWVSLGFLVASLLCSMAWSLESMIVFRALQGFTGGALIPLAFTLTLIKLPEHHRAKGMAMFAMTATFAPSIGPTLGGWLTENWGWEYIFYINIPPGLIMIAGLMYGLEKKEAHWELLKSTDYAGIVTLGVGLGCLQVFLEEGHRKDWLESDLIVTLGSIALISLITFVIVQFSKPNPLINLGILGNRNFGLSSISSIGMGVGLYGSIYLLPLYLAQIQNYNALQIGEVIMWMGVPQLFLIPLVPKLMKVVSPKWLCTIGLRPVRPGEFFFGRTEPGLCRAAVQPDPDRSRIGPAADHGHHFADRHGVHPAPGCGVGVEPVQHPAQPRWRHRHRPPRHPAGCADQDLLRLSARSDRAEQSAGGRAPGFVDRLPGQRNGGVGQAQ